MENDFSHNSNLWFFWSSWTILMCFFRFPDWVKEFPQKSQAFVISLPCTQLCIYSKSVKFISLAFLYIDFHFDPSLQTSFDAIYHIGSYFEHPPKIHNFFPLQHFHFPIFWWKIENVVMGKNCQFLVDLQNRTQYDRWHHVKSVEMDKSENQYIKKPEKIFIWHCLRQNRALWCGIYDNWTLGKKF